MHRVAIWCCALCLLSCSSTAPNNPAASAATAGETSSPKDSPVAYRVLSDVFDRGTNTLEFHVLIADQTKHDDVEGLLKFLYRHLMTRHEDAPGSVAGYVYSNQAQYQTPP